MSAGEVGRLTWNLFSRVKIINNPGTVVVFADVERRESIASDDSAGDEGNA